jgi:hypothetical protein
MAFLCVMDWILILFPAHPKLAPIFNPVTHMVPLPFPLLLIFPALAIDLILRLTGEPLRAAEPVASKGISVKGIFRGIGLAILLGVAFFAILIAAQWYFSKFMLSSHAKNWFFMGDRVFGYNFPKGDWQTEFWHTDPHKKNADLITVSSVAIILGLASASSWIGLFFGNWMRKVRR